MRKRSCRRKNEILECHGDWLLLDISTSKFPNATMAVDTSVFEAHEGGRISAWSCVSEKYISAQFRENGKSYRFHCAITTTCDGYEVDHKLHGSMSFVDNRLSNLRAVTSSQNKMNRRPPSTNKTGICGVFWQKQHERWQAQIRVNGKAIHLGYYDNIDFAIGARQQAEKEYFGEYAYRRS